MSLTDTAADRLRGASVLVVTCVLALALVAGAVVTPLLAVLGVGLGVGLVMLTVLGIERTGTAIVLLAMFFAPMNDVRPVPGLTFVTMSDLLFALGFPLLVPTMLRRTVRVPPLFLLGAGLIVVMGLIASVLSPTAALSLNHMSRLLVAGLGLPLAFVVWQPERPVIRQLAWAYLLGATVSTLAAVVQGPFAGTGRYLGLTTHPNFFGLTCLLAIALAPFLLRRDKTPWALGLAVLICGYGIWISGSRAALLVVILLGVAYPVLESSAKALYAMLAAGTAVLALRNVLLGNNADNALGRLLGSGTADASDVAREEALKLALDRFTAHPLAGNGFAEAMEAHNIYLQIAVAVGVIGTLGYLMIFASMLLPLVTGSGTLRRLAYPALAYALVGLITNSLWDRFIWSVLALSLLGASLAHRSPAHGEPRSPSPADLSRLPGDLSHLPGDLSGLPADLSRLPADWSDLSADSPRGTPPTVPGSEPRPNL